MNRLLPFLLLVICMQVSFGQQKSQIDSLNLILNDSACTNELYSREVFRTILDKLSDTSYTEGHVSALKNYGTMLYCLGKSDSAILFYRSGAETALTNTNLLSLAGKLYNNVGYLYQMNGEYDSSITNFNKALNIAISIDDVLIQGAVYTGIGIVQQQTGQLDSALATYLKAYKLAETNDLPQLKVLAMVNIATIHYDHFPERVDVNALHENLKFATEIGDLRHQISFLEFLGYIASDSSDHKQAIDYFNQAILVNKELKDQNAQVLILQGLGYAHTNQGNYEESAKFLEEAIQIASQGSGANLPRLYLDNTINYLRMEAYDLAEKSARRSIEEAERMKNSEYLAQAYKRLAEALNGKGEFAQAYLAQLEHSERSKEILDATKSKQLTEMETKYETEKKEAAIASLSKEAQIQNLKLEKQRYGLVSLAVLIAIIIGGSVLGYRQYQLKQERNLKDLELSETKKRLEIEQQYRKSELKALRSQMNPHFVFNALNSIQEYIMLNEKKLAGKYLGKFADLMRTYLNHSQQKSVTVQEEVDALKLYLELEKLRFEDELIAEVNVSPTLDPHLTELPALLVQPFVENALKHGLLHKKGLRRLELTFEGDQENLRVLVRDNGIGREASQKINSRKPGNHKSYATGAIQERIDLINFGLKNPLAVDIQDLKTSDGLADGTLVTITVPLDAFG
ncbi:tetratricopeptide repeat-containing sensor histidine kinase [Marinoscillum furvescens]|uniref:Tetratricopeptide repeat protein n=1 Tax=Marinoscillum furvescens DSM 4134 TaxID=1122208 RepID=A0A3D9L5M7_MARFU|nr:tetratricopeptide repeat protein [Marinoscillum furvescens]RED98903.1 tetratricopeptide repeat protein [Marinoscillum furvescens DSM 4134]